MSISPNIVIMTKDELRDLKDEVFQLGVASGRFKERLIKTTPTGRWSLATLLCPVKSKEEIPR